MRDKLFGYDYIPDEPLIFWILGDLMTVWREFIIKFKPYLKWIELCCSAELSSSFQTALETFRANSYAVFIKWTYTSRVLICFSDISSTCGWDRSAGVSIARSLDIFPFLITFRFNCANIKKRMWYIFSKYMFFIRTNHIGTKASNRKMFRTC